MFIRRCNQHEWGYPSDSSPRGGAHQPPEPELHGAKRSKQRQQRIPIIVYADNYWLLATNLDMLKKMTDCWHGIITERLDCRITLNECTFATTRPDDNIYDLRLDSVSIKRAPRSTGFKVLGAQVTFDNSASAAVTKLIANAWGAFHKHRGVLCTKKASPARRMHLLDTFVRPVAMYAVGSLNLTRAHLQQFHGLHFKMLRKMLGIQRPQHIDLQTYLKLCADKVNDLMNTSGTLWWDEYALKSIHGWAGHIGRMNVYDERRLVLLALKHRNRQYLLRLQASEGSQCHHRRFHTWRWEKSLYDFYGAEWIDKTAVNEDWADSFPEWLQWRKHRYNMQISKGKRSTKRFKLNLDAALASVTEPAVPSSTSSSSSSSSSSSTAGPHGSGDGCAAARLT